MTVLTSVHATPSQALQFEQRGICPQELVPTIDRIIRQPIYRTAKWGIRIEAIDHQAVLYTHNENKLLIPASNIKLFTTAAALRFVSEQPQRRWNGFDRKIRVVNRDSNNYDANVVLRRIGGARQVKTKLGIPAQSLRQVDGSGLSRRNATTPATLVALLKAVHDSPEYNQFYQSLAIAGVSGTLRHRFINTPIQGQVRAKTGTLSGVRALSGYLEHPIYGTIVFSILVNQPGRGDTLRQGIDQIVLNLGKLTPCD